jgi:hypothetical protein
MRIRQFLVVIPLVLSLLRFSISFPAEFSLHTGFLDTHIPEISKDYFPPFTDFALVASKSKPQIPLSHVRLFLQFLHRNRLPEAHFYFCSTKIVPPSAISLVALATVMRC